MPETEAITALIDRIVAGACIPGRAERDDVRRELLTHFEEAATSPESVAYAIRRFGDEAMVTDSLRRVYRWEYRALYLAKVVASVVASFAAALLIVAAFNLRLELETEVWRLAPGFSRAAGLALAVTFGLIAAWEVVRRPFSPRRAERHLPAEPRGKGGRHPGGGLGIHRVHPALRRRRLHAAVRRRAALRRISPCSRISASVSACSGARRASRCSRSCV